MNISLKEIIGQFLNSKDTATHEFRRLWNIAVYGIKNEFNLDVTGSFKTRIIDVNANKTVTLPSDYIGLSKIGVLNDRGEVCTFSRNNQLTTYSATGPTSDIGRNTGVTSAGSMGHYPFNNLYYTNYFYNNQYYTLFGADSGTAVLAEYKLDENNGIILLNQDFYYANIVLEYLSDGYDEDEEDYFIDVRASEAMDAYLRWRNAIDLVKKFSLAQVRTYRKDYYNSKRMAKMRVNPFNVSDFNKAIRVSNKLAPKA